MCHKLEGMIIKFYVPGVLKKSKKMGIRLRAWVLEVLAGFPEFLLLDCCIGLYTDWKWRFPRTQLLQSIIFVMLLEVADKGAASLLAGWRCSFFSSEFYCNATFHSIVRTKEKPSYGGLGLKISCP